MIEVVTPIEEKMEVTCPHCGSLLRYTDEDIDKDCRQHIITCPKCREIINIGDEVKPFTFPDSFYHFGASKGAKHIPNETIEKWIDKMKDYLKSSKVGSFYSIGSGDTIVFGHKDAEDTYIWVCTNYWEDSCPNDEVM